MDITKESPIIISLCTGIRGLERGLERALQCELRVAAYAEIESFIVANIIAGMEAGILAPAPVWPDLKTFPFADFYGKVHGIIGGYPCQPFSVAGKQKGTEDPRHLWPYIKAGIAATRPVFCFFENVRGHLKLGFEEVYNDLCGLGYQVRFGIYSAEEVGAPHRRERLFILAVENSYCESIRNNIGEIYRYASRTGAEVANATGEGLQKSRFFRIGELSEETGTRLYNRPEQPGEELGNSEGNHQRREWEPESGRQSFGGSGSEELADTGIHIGRIEAGNRDVSISTIEKICDYFNISVAEFFKGYKS